MNIRAVPFEIRVRLDLDLHEQVARRRPGVALAALAAQADLHARVDAGRHAHIHRFPIASSTVARDLVPLERFLLHASSRLHEG